MRERLRGRSRLATPARRHVHEELDRFLERLPLDRIPLVSGIDRAMFGYFGFKLAAERVVTDSGLPWTTLRATQFHDLFLTVAQQMAKLPLIPVPA